MDGVKKLGRRVAVVVILDLDLDVSQAASPRSRSSLRVGPVLVEDRPCIVVSFPLLASPSRSLVGFGAAACRIPTGRVGAARSA
jgi:hypothetical protein